ncbi:DsbA family protein [Candidatus Pacearchaeota archaeon]|nr:DsbA family protein [Candidatus Pacearchaeota archaeon]
MSETTITIKKETLWMYSTFILAAILIIGAVVYFSNGTTNGNSGNVNTGTQPAANLPAQGQKVEVNLGDSPREGNPNAKVTVVEFTDYQCPFCGRHYTDTYLQLKKNYIDTGKILYVLKDYPLSQIHPEAQKAAEATRCVRDQKGDAGYLAMHDKIFSNQASLSVDNEKKWAREIGVNGAQFDSCLDSGKHTKDVQDEQAYGATLGVQGTPSFFVNGQPIEGAQPYSVFQQAIEAGL